MTDPWSSSSNANNVDNSNNSQPDPTFTADLA
jgi:hypothetical protein